ncbi:MAG: DNA primase catalytic subunit PriS [Methanophagales archaeon ANME-1-THS]|nr:MAG: DNA primase catalytic subunit PriS [Methanophagales archaeon ANME-1-THS]
MDEKTRLFVKRRFEEYYRRAGIELPGDFWQREWGFVHFDQYYPTKLVMRRHKSFPTRDDVLRYLREDAPAHAYYSSALYQYPAAAMPNKGWIGSDLIFDLDADHILSEAEFKRSSYAELLERVKQETVKLLDFLITDFGFGEEQIELVFSGSRGYHVHIRTPEVRGLGSRERREIVDYLMATGLEMDRFLVDDGKEKGSGGEKLGRGDLRLLPDGWGKRLLNGLIEFLHEIAEMEEERAIEVVRKVGELERKKALEIIRIARDESVMRRIEDGQIPRFAKPIRTGITRMATNIARVKSADRPDEPVTADIKRLIRLPTSLHGKSSLEVKPVQIESFQEFDPLADAVAFGDSPVKVQVVRDATITLKSERYELKAGESASVPEHVALYFICRGAAEIQ